MKKIISGKLYDTDTAKRLGSYWSDYDVRSFSHLEEKLYRKRTGEFFLYGEGGPMTKYAVSCGNNSWGGGEEIIPLSYDKAREWAEEHLDADEYAAIFGMPDEGGEDTVLYVRIPAALDARLRAEASRSRESLSDCVQRLLASALDH